MKRHTTPFSSLPAPLAEEGGRRSRPDEGSGAQRRDDSRLAARPLTPDPSPAAGEGRTGARLASAYPERIAMARGRRGEFLMANGRAASLEPHDALAGEPFLAIGEVAGRAAAARILLAAPLSLDDIEAVAGASIETAEELTFERASASLRARRRRLGALVLAEQTLAVPPDEQSALALARGVLSLGLARLPWTKSLSQWRDRVIFLRRAEGEPWPDLSDERLAEHRGWLAPYLVGKTRLDEIGADELSERGWRDHERDARNVGRVLRLADDASMQIAHAVLRIMRLGRLGIVGIGPRRHGRADVLLNLLILLDRRLDHVDPDRAGRDRLVRLQVLHTISFWVASSVAK